MPSLDEYSKKRHFDVTPEPKSADTATALRSFALPKAHFPETSERLLLIETEMHPLSYADIKSIDIPAGEYGAGKLKAIDSGTFEIVDSSPNKFTIKFYGKIAQGIYTLVHTSDQNWLLLKSAGGQ